MEENSSYGCLTNATTDNCDPILLLNTSTNANGSSDTAGNGSSQQNVIKYIVVVLYLVTTSFGMCGNTLTIFVLLRHRRVRSVATCFILNLAVADDLFLVSLPFMAYSTYVGRWVFGDAACRIMNAFWGVNLYASVFTMTLMSVDRYLAIVQPLKSIRYRTTRRAVVKCAVIWTLGFLFVLPLVIYSTVSVRRKQCEVGGVIFLIFFYYGILVIRTKAECGLSEN